MAKSIIFDMDGTLFQTDKILEISLEGTFAHLRSIHKWSGETPIQKYREIMGVPLPKVWEALLPEHSHGERKYTDAYFLERLIENIEKGNGALYPHAESVLQFLKENGYSIYIASNGLTAYLEAIVKHYHLDRWITETFSIQEIDSLNKADLVKTIVNKYGIVHGVVVGDRLSDINAAKENGLISIGCHFDFAQEDELVHAHVVIHNLNELRMLLPALNDNEPAVR